MLQILLQSFIRAEVTIGVVLTILLISGRDDPQSIGLSLGGLAVFFLLYGILAVSRRNPRIARFGMKREKPEVKEDSAPCTPRMSRRTYVLRTVLMAAFLGLTAGLIYGLAPWVG
jgi:hypothetical protein